MRVPRRDILATALVVVALVGGITMLVAASRLGLAVLMASMSVLWLVATVHHMVLPRGEVRTRSRHRSTGGPALTH